MRYRLLCPVLWVGFVLPLAGQVGLPPEPNAILSPEVLLRRASKFMDSGNYRYAVGDLSRALRADPGNAKALALRGTAYSKLQEADKALADLNNAIRLSPADPDLYAARADAQDAAGRLADSKADREAAERLRGGGGQTAKGSAMEMKVASIQSPKVEAAIIEGDPVTEPAMRSLPPATPAVGEIKPREVRGPIEKDPIAKDAAAKDSVSKDTALAAQHNQKARALINDGKVQEAIAELNQAIQLEPGGAIHYNTRGYAYLVLKDAKRALTDFDQAIHWNPNYVNAYVNRGAARKLNGDSTGSASDKAKARELAAAQ